jgi:hypothetical protein
MPLSEIASLRQARDRELSEALAADDARHELEARLARLAPGRSSAAERQTLKSSITREAERSRSASERHADFRTNLRDRLDGLLLASPEKLAAGLSDDFPIMMLPVRLETRFATGSAGPELKVRIFPDDISVATAPAPVGEKERAAAELYWRARAASAAAPTDEELARDYRGTWNALAARHGGWRASWLVRATRPTNWDGKAAAPSALTFAAPPTPLVPPVARAAALPDRFVIRITALGETQTAVGRPIPDDLALAPDPSEADSWVSRDTSTGRLQVADSLKWLVDFEAAIEVGMALRIPLAPPFDTRIDRLVAIGLGAAGAAPGDGPVALEALFSAHRAGEGLAILGAGTPTNNTDAALSGWAPLGTEAAALFAIEDTPPVLPPAPGGLETDGWRLRRLFGLSTDLVERLPGAARTDIAEAMAMNKAAAPGTIDAFVEEFLEGVAPPDAGAALHGFFTEQVSGRGAWPALRFGRQPYGIVTTSAWDRWTPELPSRLGGFDIESGLFRLIGHHRLRWMAHGRQAPHAGQAAVDPFERLLRILGQLASSATFDSRKAVSDEYVTERLRFGKATAEAISSWFDQLTEKRRQSLTAAGMSFLSGSNPPLIAAIAFMRDRDHWAAPIVDGDPILPLSEEAEISSFAPGRNYLDWLATASRADLTSERFAGPDGASVARPSALLYTLLRHALMSALEQDVLGAARQFGRELFDVIDREPLIANVGAAQHVLRRDYLDVDAARLGLATNSKPLADWVLEDVVTLTPQARGDAVRVAEAREALAHLSRRPTAALERLLAEHVDLCSYRLDAWITALYEGRLARMLERSKAAKADPGYYLGAFGWVENLEPMPKGSRREVPMDAVPPALRAAADRPLEDRGNGGLIHAPSLGHAATAAVLRNAHLSRAASAPGAYAVDISSARARMAGELTEGVRGGQPLAALLGYQLERGLHERHPGLELDAVIYALRDAFPLTAGQLADSPPGVSVEKIDARNVVHGLDLLKATENGAYPWSIARLPAPSSSEARAVTAEIAALRAALDAVGDLLLAESVHQTVQGNLERTKAALQAMSDPEAPPEFDVLRTPRSGRTFAYKVVLPLDVSAASAWTGASPRSLANPRVNAWLAAQLPSADDIRWTVQAGVAPLAIVKLSALGLQPIDLVLMSGESIGDGASELERLLLRRARRDAGVADDFVTVVAPAVPSNSANAVIVDFGDGGGATSLASLSPLLARLRRLIVQARPLHAAELWPGTRVDDLEAADVSGSASGHPLLDDFKELRDRLDAAASLLDAAKGALAAALTPALPLRTALESGSTSIGDPAWPGVLQALRDACETLAGFGFPEASPPHEVQPSQSLADALIGQAQTLVKLAGSRLEQALVLRTDSFGPLPVDEPAHTRELARRRDLVRRHLIEAGKALFGPTFVIVPLYRHHAVQVPVIAAAVAAPAEPDAVKVKSWLHSLARVRPALANAVTAAAAARWHGRPSGSLLALQLPHIPGTPWVAGPFGNDIPLTELMSIVSLAGPPGTGAVAAGLVIDDWSETVPGDRETTGIAFHCNRPNAVAPQAMLVAVPSKLRGHWEWDDVVGAVEEALDLAKIRAVEPDAIVGGEYFQLLPAVLSEFSASRLASVLLAERGAVAAAFATEI